LIPSGSLDSKRRLQLLFALALLITALVWVVMRNRQFWVNALDEELTNQTTSDTINRSEPRVNRALAKWQQAEHFPNVEPRGNVSFDQETILSPLQVDVTYASGQRQLLSRNSAIHLDLKQNPRRSLLCLRFFGHGTEPQTSGSGVQVRFSTGGANSGATEEPVYPLPAQQASVQGSVVLQAP
jgi:hypothetical protein